MSWFNSKEKKKTEKAIELVKKVIEMSNSILDTRFRRSHNRIAVIYRSNDKRNVITIDLNESVVKYGLSTFKMKKKQFKDLTKFFDAELDKRQEKFYMEELEKEINDKTN